MPKVVSYEEKNYKQKKEIYDSIYQVFSDLKNDQYGKHSWNKLVQDMEGVSMRFVGEGCLEVTCHRYEVATVEMLARREDTGSDFQKEVVSALKKRFKKHTGKALKLKKVTENQTIDKVSRVQADTSWMLGSSRYGYGARPTGRYLVRDSVVYEFDIDLLG